MSATKRQLALWLLLSVSAAAQQIDDPANLMGERVSPPALADTLPIDHGAPALEQLLRKLRTRASMMLIVAHPDDEDGGLLTYESRGMGARVAMLTLTRGEGGQNLMSADFNDALGLIRTQELLAEDRYTGVDQMFGTEVDFGFSKTKEETLKQWGHDRVLYDAVRAVRLYRPLVLASVFVGGVTDGHGHHQVAGEICQEVFKAAADPKVFPEMGLPAWAPLRVYARVPFSRVTAQGMFDYATGRWSPPKFHNYVTGEDITHEPVATVTIHEGDKPNIPAFEGDSYVQFARRGLALQKSQIGANFRVPPAGAFDVGYTLMASRVRCTAKAGALCLDSETWDSAKPSGPAQGDPQEDLFSGINTSLPTIADLAPSAPASLRTALAAIDAEIAEAQKRYDPANTGAIAEPLARALKMLDLLAADMQKAVLPQQESFSLLHELRVKRVQLNNALVDALGVSLTAQGSPTLSTMADSQKIHLSFSGGFHGAVELRRVTVTGVATQWLQLDPSPTLGLEPLETDLTIRFHKELSATRPYFSRPDAEQPFYNVAVGALRNAPATPPPLIAAADLTFAGVRFTLASTVSGERTEAEVVAPPWSVAVLPSAGIVATHTASFRLNAWVRPFHGKQEAAILSVPAGWAAKMTIDEPVASESPELHEHWIVTPARLAVGNDFTLQAHVEAAGFDYKEGYRPVGYPGLTYTNYYTPAAYKVTAVDVTTAPNLRIAYLPGTGDEVPQFLPSLGATATILTPKDLTAENLKQYDAVVLGVRAYAAHPELSGAGSKPLNDYAALGGVVIVQYNTVFNPASAPFPYQVPGDSAHNVVEEAQPVTVLKPDAPLLTWPNRITSADFNGWIEERGHGFASEWAPEYEPLLETHDVDQDPQKGGLLVAKVGKGAYIYCALALYRQLPEGVPGAYRLIANLLSYAKNPQR